MNIYAENKLFHYNLNQDYPIPALSYEDQTNALISKEINKFVNKYQEDFGKKSFVYEFNDDLPSMIGYKILQAVEAIKPNFTFRLFGKSRKTKKMLPKGQRFCSKRELKRNQNIIVISNFNSIYKVVGQSNSSNFLVPPNYRLIENFTLKELQMAQVFYHIGYTKDIFDKNKKVEDFFKWEADLKNPIPDINTVSLRGGPPQILLVWLDNTENDLKILQEVEQSDDIAFYFFDQDNKSKYLFDNFFALLLKRKTNIPAVQYMNLNNYELPVQLSCTYKIGMKFIGDWDIGHKKFIGIGCSRVGEELSQARLSIVKGGKQ